MHVIIVIVSINIKIIHEFKIKFLRIKNTKIAVFDVN